MSTRSCYGSLLFSPQGIPGLPGIPGFAGLKGPDVCYSSTLDSAIFIMLNFLNRGALVQLGLRVFLESLVVMVNKEILDPRDHREIGYNFLIHLHLLFLTVITP